MKIRFGYRIIKNNSNGQISDCNMGAYGFENEDDALLDAKHRLEEFVHEGISYYSIQCYSYNLEEDVKGRIYDFKRKEECL